MKRKLSMHGLRFNKLEKQRNMRVNWTLEERKAEQDHRRKKANTRCLDCDILISPYAKRCVECSIKHRSKKK